MRGTSAVTGIPDERLAAQPRVSRLPNRPDGAPRSEKLRKLADGAAPPAIASNRKLPLCPGEIAAILGHVGQHGAADRIVRSIQIDDDCFPITVAIGAPGERKPRQAHGLSLVLANAHSQGGADDSCCPPTGARGRHPGRHRAQRAEWQDQEQTNTRP